MFGSLTVNGGGCGGKGGAITLGLQMGFPQEGHAPVFSETETEANMAADPSLHLKGFRRLLSQGTETSSCLFMCQVQRPPAREVETAASESTRSRLRCLAQKIFL